MYSCTKSEAPMAALGAPPDDSRGEGELLFNEPATRRGAGVAATRRATIRASDLMQ